MTDKWMIAGCGPSLHNPGGYRVCTLNRAICAFDHVDVAIIYHSLSLEAVADHLHKAEKIVMPFPFDSLVDFVTRGKMYEYPWTHPIAEGIDEKAEYLMRQINMPHHREFIQASDSIPFGSSVTAALGYLVKMYDIREIRTVGVDGGPHTAPTLDEAYSNRDSHPSHTYTKWLNHFIKACAHLEVEWYRVVNGHETKFYINFLGEEPATDRSEADCLNSTDALVVGI